MSDVRRRRRVRTKFGVGAAVVGVIVAAGALVAGPALAESPAQTPSPVQTASPEQAPSPEQTVHAQPLTPGTPCSITAKACVDLDSQRSWLIQNGTILRGPVTIASGGNGQETPVGHSLRVYRKDKDHVSQESRTPDGRPSPMPWSTFFDDGGIAFHGGDPARSSAGCIRMQLPDAEAWFTYLQIGDQVQVVRASEEMAARGQ